MIEAHDLLAPGQAAVCFRTILDAFARPGTQGELPALDNLPAPLNAATASFALSLCDFQTPIWLSPQMDQKDVRDFLRFYTGTPIVREAGAAAYAICLAAEYAGIHPLLSKGNDEYPDRAATVVVQISGFAAPHCVKLAGPGIKTEVVMAAAGFGPTEWNLLASDRILFPLGVDVALTAGTSLMAIPRSTHIASEGGR